MARVSRLRRLYYCTLYISQDSVRVLNTYVRPYVRRQKIGNVTLCDDMIDDYKLQEDDDDDDDEEARTLMKRLTSSTNILNRLRKATDLIL